MSRTLETLLFWVHRVVELWGFDLTQEEFAFRIGVSQSHLSAMERGEKEIGAGDLNADQSGVWEVVGVVVDWGEVSKECESLDGEVEE